MKKLSSEYFFSIACLLFDFTFLIITVFIHIELYDVTGTYVKHPSISLYMYICTSCIHSGALITHTHHHGTTISWKKRKTDRVRLKFWVLQSESQLRLLRSLIWTLKELYQGDKYITVTLISHRVHDWVRMLCAFQLSEVSHWLLMMCCV